MCITFDLGGGGCPIIEDDVNGEMEPIPTLSRNEVLCSNALVRALGNGAPGTPTIVRDAVSEHVVAELLSSIADDESCRGAPLLPFAKEAIVSQERNPTATATMSARSLVTGEVAGQLRLEAPAEAVAAVTRLLAGAAQGPCLGDSLTFVNSPGIRTPMHTDARDGLLLHVSGEKRVVFAAPGGGRDEVYRSLRVTPGTQAELFPEDGDLAASLLAGDLFPGDLLLIPRRWWHDVESRTGTISVSVRVDLPRGEEHEEALEGF